MIEFDVKFIQSYRNNYTINHTEARIIHNKAIDHLLDREMECEHNDEDFDKEYEYHMFMKNYWGNI